MTTPSSPNPVVKQIEKNLREVLARNQRILAVMRRVEESEIPEGKSPLDVLAEELKREGLLEVKSETT